MKTAVILAAGKGIRMLPLTKKTPKCLIRINGRPFLSYLIDNLRDAGFIRFVVVVGHLKDSVEAFFKEERIKAEFIEQLVPKGTGDAVLRSEKKVDGSFIVVNSDNLWSSKDLRSVAKDDDLFYIGAKLVTEPSKYGVLEVKGDTLVRIDEKPKNASSSLINTGLYKMTPQIFPLLKKLKPSVRGEIELTDALNRLATSSKVRVMLINDDWLDLGSKEDIPRIEGLLR